MLPLVPLRLITEDAGSADWLLTLKNAAVNGRRASVGIVSRKYPGAVAQSQFLKRGHSRPDAAD